MRLLLPLLLPLVLVSGAFAQSNVGGPTQIQDPAYPLKVRIMERNVTRIKSTVRSWGRADLYDGQKVQGFDYQTDCNLIVMTSRGDERFSARWRRQDKELEMLVTKIGADKPQKCVVKAILQPFSYEFESGAIATEPLSGPPPDTQTAAIGPSPITVEDWSKPESGWLYVLDPKPDMDNPG